MLNIWLPVNVRTIIEDCNSEPFQKIISSFSYPIDPSGNQSIIHPIRTDYVPVNGVTTGHSQDLEDTPQGSPAGSHYDDMGQPPQTQVTRSPAHIGSVSFCVCLVFFFLFFRIGEYEKEIPDD